MADDPSRYYAVPDPNHQDQITYWRKDKRGNLRPWPPKARYGPVLLRRDVPPDMPPQDRNEWVRGWYREHAYPWHDAIRATIDTEPELCLARFATFTSRCCWCGRTLTDAASKTYGIGPDCRSGLSDNLLAALANGTGKAHAEYLKELREASA